jgi:hypothetical protein
MAACIDDALEGHETDSMEKGKWKKWNEWKGKVQLVTIVIVNLDQSLERDDEWRMIRMGERSADDRTCGNWIEYNGGRRAASVWEGKEGRFGVRLPSREMIGSSEAQALSLTSKKMSDEKWIKPFGWRSLVNAAEFTRKRIPQQWNMPH